MPFPYDGTAPETPSRTRRFSLRTAIILIVILAVAILAVVGLILGGLV